MQQVLQVLKRRLGSTVYSWRQRLSATFEAGELAKSDLPDNMRKQIARLMLFINAHRGNSLPNPLEMLGYSVGYFHEDDLRYLFQEIFVEGEYLFRSSIDRPLIVDCGSNIGLSILFFKCLYPNASIIAFEPDASTFSMLRRNMESNHVSDVTIHNCALSGEDGEITFYHSAERSGSLLMSTANERLVEGRPIKVAAKRLSPFITEPVDLLKMDIEGAEHSVLLDLASTGKLHMIRQMLLEYHHHIVENADQLSSVLRLLEDHGFGYQLRTASRKWPMPKSFSFSRWPSSFAFQDISIFAYKK